MRLPKAARRPRALTETYAKGSMRQIASLCHLFHGEMEVERGERLMVRVGITNHSA